MHQPAHQLGDVIVNIERTYMPDPSSVSIDHSNNNYEAIDLLGSRSGRGGREGGDKSTIQDENDQVPRAHKAKEKSEERRETRSERV